MRQPFSLVLGPNKISVLAFDPKGPAIELMITSPHDDPRRLQVPVAASIYILRRRLAFHGALTTTAEGRKVRDMLYDFCRYIVDNHGWSKPYRLYPTEDADFLEKVRWKPQQATV